MGDTGTGWAEARRIIVRANIQGYDIVFLQEVPWVEDGPRMKRLATKELKVARKGSGIDTYILYNPGRLQEEDASAVTHAMRSVAGWKNEYSEQLCVQVFTLKGKGDTSKFVAISLHAPYKNKGDTRDFCNLVFDFIEKVVTVHSLPVLVGGDFNTDIYRWKDSGFKGLDYEAGRTPIDFITMKVPEEEYHLEMAKVQKMECDEITITDTEDIEVKLSPTTEMTVAACKDRSTANFSKHLCGDHMPLTVVVTYSPNAIQSEGSEQESMSREELEAKNAKLERKIQELTDENEKVKEQHQEEIRKMEEQYQEEIRKMEEQHQEEIRKMEEQYQEEIRKMEKRIGQLQRKIAKAQALQ